MVAQTWLKGNVDPAAIWSWLELLRESQRS